MPDKWKPTLLMVLMVLGTLVVGGTFVWIGLGIKLRAAGPELTLPLVVIVGVVVLLVTLALVAVTFSLLDLSDKGQALALPEGSVRAVIALMLLVVFAIAAIFLYSNVSSSGQIKQWAAVTEDQLADLRKQVTVVLIQPTAVVPTAPGQAAPAPATTGQPQAVPVPAKPTFTVYYRDISSAAGDDIAKQLIVLLGTLVTAVASFYFGSSSVASARDAADRARTGGGGPNAASVDPPILKADGSSQRLTITGANLAKVNAVKLKSADGKASISADAGSVKASDTTVVCTVTVPAKAPGGQWDVVVSDNANNDSTVPKGITIDAPTAAAPDTRDSAAKPKPEKVDPPKLVVGGDPQLFKILGSDLKGIDGVKLTSSGNPDIGADDKSVAAVDSEVSCKMTITTGTATGPRDVVLMKGAETVATVPGAVTIGA